MNAPDPPEVLKRVEAGLELVDQIARKFARLLRDTVEFDDLVGYGRAGLLAAARRYDPSRGIPFEPYATFRIRGAVLDSVRGMALPRRTYERIRAADAATRFSEGLTEHTFVPRSGAAPPSMAHKLSETMAAMSTAVALGVMAETASDDDGELVGVERSDPEQRLSNAQIKALVHRFVDQLPHEEAELIRRHYLEDERFDKVAADLKISKSWASRLHSRAIVRLSRQMQRAG